MIDLSNYFVAFFEFDFAEFVRLSDSEDFNSDEEVPLGDIDAFLQEYLGEESNDSAVTSKHSNVDFFNTFRTFTSCREHFQAIILPPQLRPVYYTTFDVIF